MEIKEMMTAAYGSRFASGKTEKAEGKPKAKAETVDVRSVAAEVKGEGQAGIADACRLDLSEAARAHGEAVKGLSADQVEFLQNSIQQSMNLMIQTMTEANLKLQGWLDEGIGFLNFDGVQIETYKFALPPVGTTPEEAAEAIAPGGDYSVEKVADRIFNMAAAIAGNDPERLKEMQDAVEEGFRQAGIAFGEAFDGAEMPQITKDTHEEITRRFEELFKKLCGEKVEEEQ